MVRRDEKRKAEFLDNGWAWHDELYRTRADQGVVRGELLAAIKANLGCATCGESNPSVLTWGMKVYAVIQKGGGYNLIKAIAKNKLKCLNCVRIYAKPTGHAVRMMMERLKMERGCQKCGMKDGRCLDFHHRDRASKIATVAELSHNCMATALREAEKCDVLCSNCHKLEHSH